MDEKHLGAKFETVEYAYENYPKNTVVVRRQFYDMLMNAFLEYKLAFLIREKQLTKAKLECLNETLLKGWIGEQFTTPILCKDLNTQLKLLDKAIARVKSQLKGEDNETTVPEVQRSESSNDTGKQSCNS